MRGQESDFAGPVRAPLFWVGRVAGPACPPMISACRPRPPLRKFRSVFNAVKTHFQQVEKRAGIGGAQLWALSVVHAQPDIGVGGLARAMDIHQTTASNLVKAMATAGLLVVALVAVRRR